MRAFLGGSNAIKLSFPNHIDPNSRPRLETPPWILHTEEYSPDRTAIQMVAVHGLLTPDGHFTDPEILATTDPSLNERALDQVANWQNIQISGDTLQPGASPQWHEIFVTVRFRGGPAGS